MDFSFATACAAGVEAEPIKVRTKKLNDGLATRGMQMFVTKTLTEVPVFKAFGVRGRLQDGRRAAFISNTTPNRVKSPAPYRV
jgi:hypothetical protein